MSVKETRGNVPAPRAREPSPTRKEVMPGLMSLARQVWLRLTREFPQRVWRLWSRLPWGRRMVALGAAVVVIMLGGLLVPPIWRVPIDGAGFAGYYCTV